MAEDEPVTREPARGSGTTTRVCYIGAAGRSGSTLLSRVLGSLPGACSVGELCWIWTYGVMRNRPCGCGADFLDCPFWSGVGTSAFGGWHQVDAGHANDLRKRVTANRVIPQLLGPATSATAADIDAYAALLAPLYAAIAERSGASVVVDNSKRPEVALLARRTPGVDLRLLHLVRRSHGVAYSWTKHVVRSDKAGREMLRKPPSRTAATWLLENVLFETIGRTGTPRHQLRYEDFVAAPRETTRQVADFLGMAIPEEALPFTGPAEVELVTDHSVWGNPMRLQTGAVTLRPDEAWREKLPREARRTVTAISWPGLVRYGYVR